MNNMYLLLFDNTYAGCMLFALSKVPSGIKATTYVQIKKTMTKLFNDIFKTFPKSLDLT